MRNVKKNYRKIKNKKDNNVNVNVAQLERSNNKYYASVFSYKFEEIYHISLAYTLSQTLGGYHISIGSTCVRERLCTETWYNYPNL